MVKETIQRAGFFVRSLTNRRLDGLDLLERDHVGVEMLFLQWRFARSKGRTQRIFESIKRELLTHGHLEESIFYPACDKFPEMKRMVSEALQDHKQFKILFKEIDDLTITSDRADVKMRILMEEVKQHVNMEENQMFPRYRMLAKKTQIDRLNRDLRANKELEWRKEKEAA
ncbi:MAG: hemerythrin domain-containing protein [Bdellovibrionia bacterium]